MINQKFRFTSGQPVKGAAAQTPRRTGPARFEAASALDAGCRAYQQDGHLANFPDGENIGIAVLADGMGGHLGGELASSIALSAAFAEIKLQMIKCRGDRSLIQSALRSAVSSANAAVGAHVSDFPEVKGMGTTLVICVAFGPDLYWASVGDSPLYVYRRGKIERLNEDHSMAPQIDAMVASGLIKAEAAADHPQRHQLISAICGGDVAKLDCPAAPWTLEAGDTIILASDGLQTLDDTMIAGIAHRKRRARSDEIAQSLMQAVVAVQDPDQDNTSVVVVKVNSAEALPQPIAHQDEVETAEAQQRHTRDPDDDSIEDADELLNAALLL